MAEKASWGFDEGDDIVPGRSALRRLGGGSQYEVYLAWDSHLLSVAVVKVRRPDRIEDGSARAGLEREAETLARLNHPVVVRMFDATLDGDRPHLLLEHLDGPTLSRLLRKYGPLEPAQLLPLALSLCSALHYLAEERTVHLDVKPSNVVMGAPPRLVDLSVARTLEDAARLTRTVGTAGYMAPEQCDPVGRGPVGALADVWGLGVTMYEAVTRTRAFRVSDDEKCPQAHVDPAPVPEEVPAQIAEVIGACLRVDPVQRPSAGELAERLEPLVASIKRPPLRRRRPRLR